jgi:hypothetical protein
MDTYPDHDDHRDGGWARLVALFGSLPYRQLAGPAVVFMFWPLRPATRSGARPGRLAGARPGRSA